MTSKFTAPFVIARTRRPKKNTYLKNVQTSKEDINFDKYGKYTDDVCIKNIAD